MILKKKLCVYDIFIMWIVNRTPSVVFLFAVSMYKNVFINIILTNQPVKSNSMPISILFSNRENHRLIPYFRFYPHLSQIEIKIPNRTIYNNFLYPIWNIEDLFLQTICSGYCSLYRIGVCHFFLIIYSVSIEHNAIKT